jgi:hypothetical protein
MLFELIETHAILAAQHALLMEVDYSLQKTIYEPDVALYTQRSIQLKEKYAQN